MRILITVASVLPGEEDGLRQTLREIRDDPAKNPYLRLPDSPSTHFARFVLFDEGDRGLRLMFVANYDGGVSEYLKELSEAGPGMDRVWGACEGYAGAARFQTFVREHYCRAQGVYVGFPDLTAEQVRNHIAIRRQVEDLLDLPDVAAFLDDPGLQPLLDRLAGVPRPSGLGAWFGEAADSTVTNALTGLQAGAFRPVVLELAERFAKWGQAREFVRVPGACEPAAGPDREHEQAIQTVAVTQGATQNEMTTITHVKPERLLRLRVALLGTGLLSRFGWPPGEFADVGTLHWFAWGVLDNGRRLVFLSTFDGSWQNYMQDFVNKLVWGLDSLYGNTYDYPAAGMQDITPFTNYIIGHQHPADVFYSAYPSETVANLLRDRRLVGALALGSNRERAERWLGTL